MGSARKPAAAEPAGGRSSPPPLPEVRSRDSQIADTDMPVGEAVAGQEPLSIGDQQLEPAPDYGERLAEDKHPHVTVTELPATPRQRAVSVRRLPAPAAAANPESVNGCEDGVAGGRREDRRPLPVPATATELLPAREPGSREHGPQVSEPPVLGDDEHPVPGAVILDTGETRSRGSATWRAVGSRVGVGLGWAVRLKHRLGQWWWYVFLPVVVATLLGLGYLFLWTYRLLCALFLPGNLQLELHLIEVLLLLLLGLDLLRRVLATRRHAPCHLVLPDLTRLRVAGTTIIGRSPGAWGVMLAAPQVSKRHLEVAPAAGGGLTVCDLDSANGTYLNGDNLRDQGAVRIKPGDSLELGLSGPRLRVEESEQRGLLPAWSRLPALLALLWCGLFLGWQANRQLLPEDPLIIDNVVVSLVYFRDGTLLAMVGGILSGLLLLWRWSLRRSPGGGRRALAPITEAVQVLIVLGGVLLYPLLPAEGLRYADIARDRIADMGAETIVRLHDRRAFVDRYGDEPIPVPLRFAQGDAEDRQLAARTEEQYRSARKLLRLAVGLAAQQGARPYQVTYFRQVFGIAAGAALLFILPLWWPWLRRLAARGPDLLARPISRRLTAGGGSRWQRLLASLQHWHVVAGLLAVLVILVTFLTPLGTSLGRGKNLFLRTPVGTVQSIELVKALFLLFMAGYCTRAGQLVGLAPRIRYLGPFLAATGGTLLMTAVQADMGGLLMLGLFVTAMFILGTGALRLLVTIPVLVGAGYLLAAVLGKASIISTRLAIWLDPRHHSLGEQVVNARQLLLSSGAGGYIPDRCLAWHIPDVHGDLAFAALAERFGLLGTVAATACWAAIVIGLLVLARHTRSSSIAGAYLLGGVAVLLVIQVVTQAGGTLGLMPFTGVPLPWLSHGLTASLIFTFLVALALAAAAGASGESGGETVLPAQRLARFEAGCAALFLLVAVAAVYWQLAVPMLERHGTRGAGYLWVDPQRLGEVTSLVEAGVFVRDGVTSRVKLDAAAYRSYRRSSAGEPDLIRLLDGLRYRDGDIVPLPYMVTNPNRFARRSLPRGWIMARDRSVLAMTDATGQRLYPLGASALHTVGVPHGLTSGIGLEARAASLLTGSGFSRTMRLHAFAADIHHGADLVLTLDTDLQRQAAAALDKRAGAVVVLDLTDGALLALVSSPAPHPDESGSERWTRLLADERGPLLNRATASTANMSPPGSTFKIVTAAAALLNRDLVDPDEQLECTGHDEDLQVSCAHGARHGKVDLNRALTVSCNVYFANLAVKLGPERMLETARLFGFNPDRPLDLAANLDTVTFPVLRSAVTLTPRLIPSDSAFARVGFGQGPVDATPLQMARVGSVFATGGNLVDPYLVRAVSLGISDENGRRQVVWEDRVSPPGRRRIVPSLVAEQMTQQLRTVFEDPAGTAFKLPGLWYRDGTWKLAARKPDRGWKKVAIAGKTGSAWRERGDTKDDAWMVAWAPAKEARVLTCVLVEDAGSGAKVAGPIALGMLRSTLQKLGAEP